MPTGHGSAAPNPNALSTTSAPAVPMICSISIASTARTRHEIACGETADRGRGSQDQRQPRGGILDRHEGNLGPSRYNAVTTVGGDRQQSPARQFVFRDTSLRAG